MTHLVLVVLVGLLAAALGVDPFLGNRLVGRRLVEDARNLGAAAGGVGRGDGAVQLQAGVEEVVVAAEQGDEGLEDDDEGDDDEDVNEQQDAGGLALAGEEEEARPRAAARVGSGGAAVFFVLDGLVPGLARAAAKNGG